MKAILVIDIDDDMIGEVDYTVLSKAEMVNGRAELRPLPEIKYIRPNDTHDNLMLQIGWNDCIDAITGETE